MNSKNIVIIGSGTGGTLTANLLAKRLRKRIINQEIKLILLAENYGHYFQPASLDIAFKGANHRKFVKDEASLVRKEIRLMLERAVNIDLTNRTIDTDKERKVSYDYLVIATGAVAMPSSIPGLSEGSLNFHTSPEESAKIWKTLQKFERGRILIAIAGVPYKCPPSPNEAAFLIDEYFRKRGIRKNVEILFLTPYGRAYPSAAVSEVVDRLFQERGIEVVPYFNLESVDYALRKVYSYEGEEFRYDMLIAVPPHFGSPVIRASGIGDRDGWIPTNRTDMTIKSYDDAYAIGDATDIPISKSGVVAHLESVIVANNIFSEIEGMSEKYGYTGRINCPMEVGFGRAIFISGTYKSPPNPNNPSRIKYLMKRIFSKLYWNVLSGDLEWIFNLYFRDISYKTVRQGQYRHEAISEITKSSKTH